MKRFYFFLSVLVMSTTLATGQQVSKRQTEIANIIANSVEVNSKMGIKNPDSIYPNQELRFVLGGGNQLWHEVSPGETQTGIIDLFLSHKDDYHVTDSSSIIPPTTFPVAVEKKGLAWWLWIIIAVLVSSFLGWLIQSIESKQKANSNTASIDPTTSGPAFVSGGVSAENAANHFRTLAERSNPGANIVIKDVKPVFISTPGGQIARVEYSDGTHQDRSFRNIPGFQGEVSTDGGKTFHREYYFGLCGNPVYARRSFLENSGLIISETPINFGDENPVVAELTPALTHASEPVAHVVTEPILAQKPIMSEYVTQTDKAMKLAEKVLGKDDPHEVTFEIPKGSEGTFKMTIKAQYPKEKEKK